MSRRCLRQATIAQLRSSVLNGGLGLKTRECGSGPLAGKPPAMAGERYVAVWVGGRTTKQPNHGLIELYTVIVTVSYRIGGKYPLDRLGEMLDQEDFGFDDFVDSVRLNLHGDHIDGRVRNRANTLLGFADDATGDGKGGPFTTGMQFVSDNDPAPVGGSWYWGQDTGVAVGLVQQLRFGRCERAQNYFSSQGVT